ncbi:MAG: hypothetical protein DLM54_06930 [Acidimicrobiales bacterium]|nr:MAG: hypothetical protein DLM54_06930 [Acidimicrobiales bacterium]
MRRLLRIPSGPPTVGDDAAHRIFSTSMVISGLRCLLSYLVLPILTPALGAAAGVGPIIGIPIAVVALVFDVRGIRRFWLADHRWRWPITVVYLAVMGLVASLLATDITHLA